MEFNLAEKAKLTVFKNELVSTRDEFEEVVRRMPSVEERPHIQVFSYKGPIPRTQKLFGETDYTYSRIKLVADPDIPELVQRCIDWCRNQYPEYEWNGGFCNYYKDNSDYVGWHSDDENTMVPGTPIVSFSFGNTRNFRIRKIGKESTFKPLTFTLCDGDVVVMSGEEFQTKFQHTVPKVYKKTDPTDDLRRINVTVRSFKTNKRARTEESV